MEIKVLCPGKDGKFVHTVSGHIEKRDFSVICLPEVDLINVHVTLSIGDINIFILHGTCLRSCTKSAQSITPSRLQVL